ncbi:hypothetical protein P7C70_g9131, partial [Phenoliferia sp. Uapishka_3]
MTTKKVNCTSLDLDKLNAPCRFGKSRPPGSCVTCELHLCIDCCDEWHKRQKLPRTHCRYHSKSKGHTVPVDPYGVDVVHQPQPGPAPPLPLQQSNSNFHQAVSTATSTAQHDLWRPIGFQSASAARDDGTVGGEMIAGGTTALAVHAQDQAARTKQFRKVEAERQAAALREEESTAREDGRQVQVFIWYDEGCLPKMFPVTLRDGLLGKSRGKAVVGTKKKPPSCFSLPSGIVDFLSSKAKAYEWSYYLFAAGSYHLWHNLSELTVSTLFPIDYHILPSTFCATLILRRDNLQIYPGLEVELESLSELLTPLPSLPTDEFPDEPPSVKSNGLSSSSSPSGILHPLGSHKRSFQQSEVDTDDDIIIVEELSTTQVPAIGMIWIICAEVPSDIPATSFRAFATTIGWVGGAVQPGLRKRYRTRVDVAALARLLKFQARELEDLSWGSFIKGKLYAAVKLPPKLAKKKKVGLLIATPSPSFNLCC